jgi:hypothetical protein
MASSHVDPDAALTRIPTPKGSTMPFSEVKLVEDVFTPKH